MGTFSQRWLVLYRTKSGGDAAKVILDSGYRLPFGLDESEVAEDCETVVAVLAVPDDYEPDTVVMNNRQVLVQIAGEAD